MEGNSSHMEEAPLGICPSVAGPQFPGHSFCCFGKEMKYCFGKEMKYCWCVESPKFSDLGKCRSTVSTGKALPGAQSWAKTQIKVTPILFHHKPPVSDMTLPQGRLHTTARFFLRGKHKPAWRQPSQKCCRSDPPPPWACFHYHLQEKSFEHQVFYQLQSLLSAEPIQAAVPAPNGIRAVCFHENAIKDLPPICYSKQSKI